MLAQLASLLAMFRVAGLLVLIAPYRSCRMQPHPGPQQHVDVLMPTRDSFTAVPSLQKRHLETPRHCRSETLTDTMMSTNLGANLI